VRSERDHGYSRYGVGLRDHETPFGNCGYIDYARRTLERATVISLCYMENAVSLQVIEKFGIPFDREQMLRGGPSYRFVPHLQA
jgi:hypothetical protein